ncbi:outer membrane lipoprotein carrier protein LolA [Candidatus Sumerlaeota bacterium]|nr:outer membrane lipoprotein carrier protein LolA [Candidatus Sumerlaeota bacterium]
MKFRLFLVLLILFHAMAMRVSAQETTSPTASSYRLSSDAERDRFLSSMPETLREIRSLRAEFVQTRHLTAFLDTLEARGVLCFAPPDKLRWELVEPYATVLIYDGRSVAKFDRIEGELRRANMGGEELMRELLGQISRWMQGRFETARDLYRLELYEGDDYRLVMRPSAEELRRMIEAVELSIDPVSRQVERVTIREPGEDYVEIRFARREINPTLDPRLFDGANPILLDAAAGEK